MRIAADAAAPALDPLATARAKTTAREFEKTMVAALLKPMFAGDSVAEAMGGGLQGEVTAGHLTEVIADAVVRQGGLGLSDSIVAHLVKEQGKP